MQRFMSGFCLSIFGPETRDTSCIYSIGNRFGFMWRFRLFVDTCLAYFLCCFISSTNVPRCSTQSHLKTSFLKAWIATLIKFLFLRWLYCIMLKGNVFFLVTNLPSCIHKTLVKIKCKFKPFNSNQKWWYYLQKNFFCQLSREFFKTPYMSDIFKIEN